MSLRRSHRPVLIGGAVALSILIVPVGIAYAADVAPAALLPYDLSFGDAVPPAPPVERAADVATVDAEALECMAKVVHHESRGQPHKGQLAVAQTLVNRLKAGRRFGGSICEVANQRGQFFNTRAYQPRRDTGDWQTALEIARETLAGSAEAAAPGAIFFHAGYRAPSGFFRGRQRVAAIGGQVFYR